MTLGKNPHLVETLQANVTEFFNKFIGRHLQHMKCAAGCAKCCRVSLSVFPVEAQLIFNWWKSISASEREQISESWKVHEGALNNSESAQNDCLFLSKNRCSIYPVRPVICRTQGLPLKVAEIPETQPKESGQFELSLCELNFEEEMTLPAPSEWLDLERLNTLLAIAQQHTPEEEIAPEILLLAQRHTGRVPLSELGMILLHNAE